MVLFLSEMPAPAEARAANAIADLLDEKQQVFTREKSLQIKEELREYERLKAAES